jgi:hypothetical protein
MTNFLTIKDLYEKYKDKMQQSEQLHKEDGLFDPSDITVYIDEFRKQIKKRNGSEFSKSRMEPEQITDYVSSSLKKDFFVTRVHQYKYCSEIWLKENRNK